MMLVSSAVDSWVPSVLRCNHGHPVFAVLRAAKDNISNTPADQSSEKINNNLAPEDALDLIRFQRRQQQLLQEQQRQQPQPLPPHASLEPQQVVTALLETLRAAPHYYEFDTLRARPHPGVVRLWQASTNEWRETMARMVGCTTDDNNDKDDEQTISALGRFLGRPGQQFAILLGTEDEGYDIDYPTDVIEWSEDEAWLECRLRESSDGELLVVLGWTLHKQNANDGDKSWYIHSFDWQDFRNDYRPGIGREEWERICG